MAGWSGTRCERGELRCAYGDGLTDWVRIRNGEVCYWANLGYGRFGAKVTMNCKLTPSVGCGCSLGDEVLRACARSQPLTLCRGSG